MSVETMSLKDMRTYQGTNPKPEDFDAFWDDGVRRALKKDPKVEQIPAEFRAHGARCSHLYFDGENGARIHAKYLCPDGDGPYPIIFVFHGYQGDSGDWFSKLAWVQQGFAVAAMDCRGQGGLSQDIGGVNGNTVRGHIIRGLLDGPEQLLYRQMFLDTVMLVNAVRQFPEIDETRMATSGGSQGGALALVCAALNPDIKKVVADVPFLCDYRRVWNMDCSGSAYEEMKDFFRHFDPMHKREEEFFTRLGYIDVQHLTPRIRGKVLWFTGLKDQLCPASTQFAAYNHITSEKDIVIYPDFGHETAKGTTDAVSMFLASGWTE